MPASARFRSVRLVVAQALPLLLAAFLCVRDVGAQPTALGTTGSGTSEPVPGDTLDLEFEWTPVPEGLIRDYFLLTHGVYTAVLPAAREEAVPQRFALRVPRPNPFAASTALHFDLPTGQHVRLQALDAQGRRVRTLANHALPAGSHTIAWDGCNEAGGRVGAGVYFYKFEAGDWRAKGRVTRLP